MKKKYSGLQLEVLSLYRAFIRAIQQKPESVRGPFLNKVRVEFQKGALLRRTQVDIIESRLTKGRKRLKLLKLDGVGGIREIKIDSKGIT